MNDVLTLKPSNGLEKALEKFLLRRLGNAVEDRVMLDRQQRMTYGLDSTARPEKAYMVEDLLAGKTRLDIYESCGFRRDGKPGILTSVYRRYGAVTSHKTSDGDYLDVASREIAEGKLFDVVDHDPFTTQPEDVQVMAKLVRPGGILILTWASEWHRFPARRRQAEATFGTPTPQKRHYTAFMRRIAPSTCVAYETYGRAIIRTAFRLEHT